MSGSPTARRALRRARRVTAGAHCGRALRVIGSVAIAIVALLVAAGTAGAQPGPYTTEVDFDRPGADYDGFEQEGSWYGPGLCRDACEAQPRCKSFTYVRPGVDGPRARCRLKEKAPSPAENRCCISGVKGGRASEPAVPSTGLQLEWRGWTPDWSRHHLRLTLTPKTPEDLVSVALTTAEDPAELVDADHAARLTQREPDFSSAHADALAIERDGRRLAPSPAGVLVNASGPVTLDLFAHDRGQQWGPGTFLLVEVGLGNGEKPRRWIRLTQPDGKVLGLWQMHCPSSSPDAFEPLMMSGRLGMDLAADGTITGRLGHFSLAGRRESSGSMSASGTSGAATITVRGTIAAKSQKPGSSSGSFEVRGEAESMCSGSGMWSSQ